MPDNNDCRDQEFRDKLERLRSGMEAAGVAGCVLFSQANQAWLGCGADTHIVIASTDGACAMVVTPDRVAIVSDNIEAGRLIDEEFAGLPIESVSCPWPESGERMAGLIAEVAGTDSLGSDLPGEAYVDLRPALMDCRASLLPTEIERYRSLGSAAEAAVRETCRELRPRMSEHDVAAALAARVMSGGAIPNLILVAADERIERYRHPIPTSKRIEGTAMVVLCARRYGLIANITRMVHFGALPSALRAKHDAVCKVDASLIDATKPGARYSDIFSRGMTTYADAGFADEWRLHHQGGPTGYMGREFKATRTTPHTVAENQAVAWNPSITGTKSEDTFIATGDGPEIMTQARDWPMVEVRIGGRSLARPDVLIG